MDNLNGFRTIFISNNFSWALLEGELQENTAVRPAGSLSHPFNTLQSFPTVFSASHLCNSMAAWRGKSWDKHFISEESRNIKWYLLDFWVVSCGAGTGYEFTITFFGIDLKDEFIYREHQGVDHQGVGPESQPTVVNPSPASALPKFPLCQMIVKAFIICLVHENYVESVVAVRRSKWAVNVLAVCIFSDRYTSFCSFWFYSQPTLFHLPLSPSFSPFSCFLISVCSMT